MVKQWKGDTFSLLSHLISHPKPKTFPRRETAVGTKSSKSVIFSLFMGFNLGLIFLNIPSALDQLITVYHVTYLRISILISSLFLSHAVMQLPAGIIADRLGIRRTLFLSISFLFLGNLFPMLLTNFQAAIAGRVITGIGTGLAFVTTMKLAALDAPANRVGMYQGFFGTSFSLGGIFAYLILPGLMKSRWESTYLIPAIISLFLFAFLFDVHLSPASPEAGKPLPLGRVLLVREGWILGAYHALAWASMTSLGNWIPSLMADLSKGATATQMAWGGALVMLISGLGRLSGGLVLLKVSSLTVAHGSLLLLAAIFLLLFFVPAPGFVLVLALLAALFSSINFGAFFQLASQSISTFSLGTLMGFINFLANLCAFLAAILFGWLRDTTGSFVWAFPILSLFALLAVAVGRRSLNQRMDENRRRDGKGSVEFGVH